MKKIQFVIYFIGAVFLTSCGSLCKQTDTQGFGGGHCGKMVITGEKILKDKNEICLNNSVTNDQPVGEERKDSNLKHYLIQKIASNITFEADGEFQKKDLTLLVEKTSGNEIFKSVGSKSKFKFPILKQVKQKVKRVFKSDSGVGVGAIISLILGLLGVLVGFFILVAGGNSGNYYAVAMLGGLILIVSMILFMFGMYKLSYHHLGTWGKIGFWLTALAPITLGMGAIIGIPLWIIGWIWGV